MRNTQGYLYFIQSAGQKAVKVGFAASVEGRLPSLQSGNPEPLHIVCGQVPIESDAEREFHRIMKPHRLVREWYPDDLLLNFLHGELLEAWGDKVEDKTPAGSWPENGDEYTNPAEIYLTGPEMSRTLKRLLKSFFESNDEEADWPGAHALPANHWA